MLRASFTSTSGLLDDFLESLRRHTQVVAAAVAMPPNTLGQVMRPAENDNGDRPSLHDRSNLRIVTGLDLLRIAFSSGR